MLNCFKIPSQEISPSTLVVLHGLGDSHQGWTWLPEALGFHWLNYVFVDAPDDYYGGFSWYDIPGDSRPGIERSRGALSELLAQIETSGVPHSQVALLGFSQGCLMTLDVGFRYSKPLAGLVGISGYVWEPDTLLREASLAARNIPALVTHGHRDTVVPLAPVRAQIQLLQAGGLKVEWHEFDKAHTVAGESEIHLIRKFLLRIFGRNETGNPVKPD